MNDKLASVYSNITSGIPNNKYIDTMKDKFSDLTEYAKENSTLFTGIGIIIFIVFLILIGRWYRNRVPIWFKNGKDAKEEEAISDSMIKRSDLDAEMTYHMFIYVDNWDYNIYWFKPILVKSRNMNQFCPMIYLEPVINNIVVTVTSETGNNFTAKVEDFPLKRWTHLAVVIKSVNIEIYIGGLLAKTVVMDSAAKQNDGDLLICPWGGFSGQLSKLSYEPRALSGKEIYELSRRPIFSFSWLATALQNLNICGADYSVISSEADFQSVNKQSLVAFGGIENSMKNIRDIKNGNNIVKSLHQRAYSARMGEDYKQSLEKQCAQGEDAPLCPVGTLACANNQRYCYYPDRDIMVSTSFDPTKDYCSVKQEGKQDGNQPMTVGGVNVWKRQQGIDRTCPNMAK